MQRSVDIRSNIETGRAEDQGCKRRADNRARVLSLIDKLARVVMNLANVI